MFMTKRNESVVRIMENACPRQHANDFILCGFGYVSYIISAVLWTWLSSWLSLFLSGCPKRPGCWEKFCQSWEWVQMPERYHSHMQNVPCYRVSLTKEFRKRLATANQLKFQGFFVLFCFIGFLGFFFPPRKVPFWLSVHREVKKSLQ